MANNNGFIEPLGRLFGQTIYIDLEDLIRVTSPEHVERTLEKARKFLDNAHTNAEIIERIKDQL